MAAQRASPDHAQAAALVGPSSPLRCALALPSS